MTKADSNRTERKAILVSMFSALSFSGLGFIFSIWSASQAVLLDAAFNLISAVTIFFGLKVSQLLSEPASIKRPAGYVALEPLYVILKGFIVFGLTAFVIGSNIILLMSGGNDLKLGVIVIYICIALVGNILTYLYMRTKNKYADSPLLQIETENWMINTVITASIALSFIIVFIFKDGFLSPYVKYVDQVIVIAVGVLTIGVPLKAMSAGTRELLLTGPDEKFQTEIENLIDDVLLESAAVRRKVFVLKTGRKRWITLYLTPSIDLVPIVYSDQLKQQLTQTLSQSYGVVDVEIILTQKA